MPNPTRPNVEPIWTQGNNAARQQPTNGEQFTGFTPNFRPPAGWHNWLFGIMSDWIAWLDFITNMPSNFPVSNVGHVILTDTNLQGQLDQCDAFLSSLNVSPVVVTPTGNPAVFTISPNPLNSGNPVVFLNGVLKTLNSDYTYALVLGVGTITFATAPAGGQHIDVYCLLANQPGSGGSSTTGGYVAHGSTGSPVVITAGGGITSTSDQRAIIFIVSSGGVFPVTANPQVTAGSKVGQELLLVGTSASNAPTLDSGNGLLLNGPITMGLTPSGAGVVLSLFWNGSVWQEDDRNV